MSRAGFEAAISTFERPKTVLASDRSAIETGAEVYTGTNLPQPKNTVANVVTKNTHHYTETP
jgi:hypothetical protein